MTDIALDKPLPSSVGLYSTDSQQSTIPPTGPWMAERRRPCNRRQRVAQSRPRLIPFLLFSHCFLY